MVTFSTRYARSNPFCKSFNITFYCYDQYDANQNISQREKGNKTEKIFLYVKIITGIKMGNAVSRKAPYTFERAFDTCKE